MGLAILSSLSDGHGASAKGTQAPRHTDATLRIMENNLTQIHKSFSRLRLQGTCNLGLGACGSPITEDSRQCHQPISPRIGLFPKGLTKHAPAMGHLSDLRGSGNDSQDCTDGARNTCGVGGGILIEKHTAPESIRLSTSLSGYWLSSRCITEPQRY